MRFEAAPAHRAIGHVDNGNADADDDDDDDGDDKDERDDCAMEMARNKPILSRNSMIVLERAKELAAHRGELLFWATRAHSLNDFCVSVLLLYVEKVLVFFFFCFTFRGIFIRVLLSRQIVCEWNALLWFGLVC